MLTSETFSGRLAQAKSASENDIANLVEKTDFDNKLKNLNKNIISNRTKNVLVENELDRIMNSKKFDSRSEFLFTYGIMGELSLFLELMWAHLWILIMKIKIC